MFEKKYPLDEKNNVIAVTQFESYLARFLIENKQFYKNAQNKVLLEISRLIAINQGNSLFKRMLFSIQTQFKNLYPQYSTVDLFLKDEDVDLFAFNDFLKFFADFILKNKNISLKYEVMADKSYSLHALCKLQFLEEKEDGRFFTYLKSPKLFDEKHRGVMDISGHIQHEKRTTQKLGITTSPTTPRALFSYFNTEHEPAQFYYKPNQESHVAQWFIRHNIPVICGTSGCARDHIFLFSKFTSILPQDTKILLTGLVATLVSKGHHSYFEAMLMLDRMYYVRLQSVRRLSDLYEQTLPSEILLSSAYQVFKNSDIGAGLIKDIVDQQIDNDSLEDLPVLRVG